MQYMLLIYNDESQSAPPSTPEEGRAMLEPWNEYTQWLTDEGLIKAGDALQPTATATSVRVQNGDAVVTDGPVAETKEQLGGSYVIEADGLDRALEAAKRCPGAKWGTIEVRPVMVFE
jgi:hypothetical protein